MIILNNKGNRQSKRASAKLRNFAGFVVAIFFVVMLLTAVGTSAWNIHLRADMDKSNLPNTLENAASNPYLLQYVDCDTEDTTTDILGADCPAFTYDNNQHTPFINNDKVTTDARKFSSELMAQFAYSYKRLAYPNTNFEDEGWFANEENLGSTAPKDAGLYQCTITNNDETYGANIGTAVVVFAIIPKNITLTIHPAVKIYGDVDLSSGASVNVGELTVTDEQNGIVDGASPLELSVFNYTASQQSPTNVKAAPNMRAANIDVKNVGIYDIEGQDDSLNYNITYNACVVVDEQEQIVDDILATYTILPRDITITVNNATSVYGDAIATLTATANALVGSDSVADLVSLSTTATSASSIGTYPITATELTNEVSKNYNITIANQGTYTITARPITVTVNDKSSVYGDVIATLTASVTTGSLVNGDTLESMFKLSTSATSSSSVGAYLITASAYVNDVTKNYAISIVNSGFYTITARAITVTVDDKSSVYGNTLATLTASVPASSLVGSDSVSSLVSLSTTATDTAVVGTYPITATALSNAVSQNYTITIANQGIYTITARAITVTVDNKSSVYGDTIATLTASVPASSLVGSDSVADLVSLSTTATATSNVGTYPITATALSNAVSKNYTITIANQGIYTITARAITVTIDNKSSVYGDTIATLSASLKTGSLIGSDSVAALVNLSTTATSSSNVGTYSITGSNNSSNYNITFENGTYTITARPITVTIDDKSSVYGDALATLTASVTEGNLVNGDTLTNVVTISTTATASSNVGTYPITGTNNSTNYAITFVDGTYTINKTPLVLTLSNKTIVYNSALSFDTNDITIEGLTNSDGVNTIIDLIFANHHEISYFIDCSYRQGDNAGRSDGIIWTADGKTEIANVLTNYTPYFNNGTYSVVKASVDKPSADNTVFTYNGAEQTYTIASSSLYTVSGNKQTNAGNHTVTVTLNDAANYKWSGATGSTESADLTFAFNIAQFEINVANLKWVYDGSFDMPNNNQITYTGTEHVLTISGLPNNVPAGFGVAYTNNRLTDHQATDVTATATFTFNANFKVFSGATTYTNTHQMSVVWNISSVPSVDKPTANSTVFTYNGTEQTYALTTSSHYTITGDKQTNAGSYTVTVTLEDGYIWADDGTTTPLTFTFTINKKTIHVNTNAILSASFDSTKRNFSAVFGSMSVESGPLFVDDSNQNGIVGGDTPNFSITSASMDGVSFNAISGNIVGTTYRVIVKNNDTNYNLTGNTQCLAKYKTALIGSTYYTIEDAIAQSGTISFAGDSTSASTYVTTTFSKFTSADYSVLANYTANHTYTISGRTLIVPYDSSTNVKKVDKAATATDVYSALTVPNGYTLNFTSSANLHVGGTIRGCNTSSEEPSYRYPMVHGVLMNDGTINIASGCNLECYGYIKSSSATSNGIINLANGATATEVLTIFDWVGGNSAKNVYSKAFPTNAWSMHAISCTVKICSGATYSAFAAVEVNSNTESATAKIVGVNNNEYCLFYPASISENNYVIKKAKDYGSGSNLYTITGKNTVMGQKDIIEVYGSYNDYSLYIKVYVEMQTGTSKSAPLGYMDLYVKSGANLNLTKSDYVFMPGTKCVIEENATVTIGSSVDMAFLNWNTLNTTIRNHTDANNTFASYCKDTSDAYLQVDGTLTVNGKISGKVLTTSTTGHLVLNNATSASFTTATARYGTSSDLMGRKTYYYSGTAGIPISAYLLENGAVSSSLRNISQGDYRSMKIGNAYCWYTTSGNLTFNDGDTTLDTTSTLALPHTFAASDFQGTLPTKQFYEIEKDGNGNVKWYTNQACTQPLAIGATVYASTNLYLHWVPLSYTIHYQYVYDNGLTADTVGLPNPTNTLQFNVETSSLSFLSIETINQSAPEYTLYGWYLDAACTTNAPGLPSSLLASATISSERSITLYAKWTVYVPSFKVYFANGNGSQPKPESVSYSSEVVNVANQTDWTLPNSISKASLQSTYDRNYSVSVYFDDWYIDAACTSKFTNFSGVTEGEERTLYAKWVSKNTLNIVTQNIARNGFTTLTMVYYKPGTEFTIPSLSNYGMTMGNENAHSYWLLSGGTDGGSTQYSTGDHCTLNDATSVTYYFFNRYKITVTSDAYTYAKVSYTGWYSSSSTATPTYGSTTFGGTSGSTNATGYVFDDGTFTIKADAYNGNTYKSVTLNNTSADKTDATTYNVNSYKKDIEVAAKGEAKGGSCIVEGTLITMADGSTKPVEDLAVGDMLFIFNHETGMFDVAPLLANIHGTQDSYDKYDVVNLHFSDGNSLKIVYEHGLFDKDLNKYVYIDTSNAFEFVGHRFVSTQYVKGKAIATFVTLDSVSISQECVRIFNPASVWHINVVANNMLTLSAGMTNLFEYDDNMQYDQMLMQQDIATYGLYTFEDFADYITPDVFAVFPFKYYKVAVGKGEFTYEKLLWLIDFYYDPGSIRVTDDNPPLSPDDLPFDETDIPDVIVSTSNTSSQDDENDD